MPYDDFGVQGNIGMGPVIGAPEPFDPMGEGSIAGWSNYPAQYDTSPSTVGYSTAGAQAERQRALSNVLMTMQQGANNGVGQPMHGLFGASPIIERSSPLPTAAGPVAAPVAGPVSAPPTGTPTPGSMDFSFLREDNRLAAPRAEPASASAVVRNLSQPRQTAPATRNTVASSPPPAPRQNPPAQRNTTPSPTFSGNVARNVSRSRSR